MKKSLKSLLNDEIDAVDIELSQKVLETPIEKLNISSDLETTKMPNKTLKIKLKPLLMCLSLFAFVLITAISFVVQTRNTASALTGYIIEINPSVCIVTDDLNVVVNAYSLNNDGDVLLSDFDVNGKTFDDAVKLIVKSSIEKGFIDFDKPPSIQLSITNDSEKYSVQKGKYARNIFENELKNKGFIDFDINDKPMDVFDFKQKMGFNNPSNHLDSFKEDIKMMPKFFNPDFIPAP